MTEHKWEQDVDGAERCANRGCEVRRFVKGQSWQRRKGAHWRKSHREPIPPCNGEET